MENKQIGFGSTCIHAGFEADENRSHVTPIYASSTYLFDSVEQSIDLFTGKEKGFIYGRFGSPTIAQCENKIAALETYNLKNEEGNLLEAKAILHASGMSAIATLFFSLLKKDQKILTHYSLYGGTQELIDKVMPDAGIETILVDMNNLETVEKIFSEEKNIGLMYLETPANPTLNCVDIKALCDIAKKYNCKTACDNTFATPFLQQPFALGSDFIIHSTTKFLNGHGTAIGGVLLGKDLDFMNSKATKQHRLLGANSNGFDAFLLNNGLKTLEVRMQRHCENAEKVATFLNTNEKIEKVYYLGLKNHPHHAICQNQMKHAGAMMSFEIKGGFEAGKSFINNLKMCSSAVSLGTCDTLISHPASTTHFGVKPELRLASGISDGLIRMSVGLENVQDIIDDLEQALHASY